MIAILSALPSMAATASTAVALELRRATEMKTVVAEQRAAAAAARAAARGVNGS